MLSPLRGGREGLERDEGGDLKCRGNYTIKLRLAGGGIWAEGGEGGGAGATRED